MKIFSRFINFFKVKNKSKATRLVDIVYQDLLLDEDFLSDCKRIIPANEYYKPKQFESDFSAKHMCASSYIWYLIWKDRLDTERYFKIK